MDSATGFSQAELITPAMSFSQSEADLGLTQKLIRPTQVEVQETEIEASGPGEEWSCRVCGSDEVMMTLGGDGKTAEGAAKRRRVRFEEAPDTGGASSSKSKRDGSNSSSSSSDEKAKKGDEKATKVEEKAEESEQATREEELDDEARAVNEENGDEPAADKETFMRKDLHEPSAETRRRHEAAGHIPYRPWCRACVAGRKPNWAHHSSEPGQVKIRGPEVHGDYCFFRDDKGSQSVPTLVLKDRDTLSIAAHVIPFRGGDHEWGVQQACRDIRRWGIRGSLTLRCDQENALTDFFNEVAKRRHDDRNARTVIEHNPVGDSQKNGFIESGCKAIEGVVRSIKFGLEERIQEKVKADTPAFAWLVEHAADMICKFQTGVDGKTLYERLRKKAWEGEIVEFGARVHHRAPGKTAGGSLQWR